MKKLLLGNEAIARGAYEAGVRVSSAYPGTPSTEINENVATYPEIYSEWAPNEKVAVEVALGAAVSGARSLACMKHVGLNVAADPFFTATYTGVNAGMVVVVADDPGMHSSQNEQDTRMLARASHAPVLDPSNSQECKDFLKLAYEISEKYDTPVILRVTTRIAHARTLVELDERVEVPLREYKRDIKKYVSMPANMIARHLYVEEREKKLAEDANTLPINRIEWADRKIGVITSGAAYNYVKEAMPTASVLKLGLAYPMPRKLIEEFAAGVDTLYVIEDMEPFYEDTIKSWGIKCSGKDRTGVQGELFARKIANKFNGEEEAGPMNTQGIPMRPPYSAPAALTGVFITYSESSNSRYVPISAAILSVRCLLSAELTHAYVWVHPSEWHTAWKRHAVMSRQRKQLQFSATPPSATAASPDFSTWHTIAPSARLSLPITPSPA